jgi:hypothetical protein
MTNPIDGDNEVLIKIVQRKVGLVTFSAGNPSWSAARRRLTREAKSSHLFLNVGGYRWKDIKPLCTNEEVDFIESHRRGFGYWYWKPKAILKFIRDHPECRTIIYLDSGCELNINSESLPIFDEYLTLVEETGAVVFSLDLVEEEWTQQCTIEKLRATEVEVKSSQIMATAFMMTHEFASDFCHKWETHMAENHWRYLMDDQSKPSGIAEFKAHRHDQSYFSILIKRREGITIKPNSEVYFAPHWDNGWQYPIWTTRNRTGIKIDEQRGWRMFLVIFQKVLNRVYISLTQRSV